MTNTLSLIIRFSPPIDDLPLIIPSPATTTPLNLHTLIRPYLPAHLAASPLRLISAGALLPPSTPLTLCLRRVPSPNPISRPTSTSPSPPTSQRDAASTPDPIYIHCAITTTTTLSAAALAAEHIAPVSLPSTDPALHPGHPNQDPQQQQQQLPLGFDALLSAGITPSEIASLRSQFLALHAHIHTPDLMPSAAEMRVLEERWLDTNTASGSAGGRGLTGGGALGNDGDDSEGAALEDMLWGTVMGFFWAVGAVGWLMREEGVWSGRRRGAVAMGVVANLAVCLLRGFG